MTLYDHPEYYEIAFSFRNIPEEARFMQSCIQRFSLIPVRRVFEVACGYAPHAEELIKLGYKYTGLDNNRNMIDYASHKWHDLKPAPKFIESSMLSFSSRRKVDFGFVMLGSLYLNSLEEMNAHFDSMAGILRSGGLYFLDWCIQFGDPLKYATSSSKINKLDGITVESKFNIRLVDSANQMYEEVWTVNVDDHGRQKRFQVTERNRAIFPQEFLLFIRSRTDFEFVGWWQDWDLSKPISGQANTNRPVALVIRK